MKNKKRDVVIYDWGWGKVYRFTQIICEGRMVALVPHHEKLGVNKKNVSKLMKVKYNVREVK